MKTHKQLLEEKILILKEIIAIKKRVIYDLEQEQMKEAEGIKAAKHKIKSHLGALGSINN